MHDYYRILGIKNSASLDDIKRAYRILARRYHPDINPAESASNKFREVQEAYQTLSDPDKRQLYDITAEAYQKKTFDARLKGYSQAHGVGQNPRTAGHSGDKQRKETTKNSSAPSNQGVSAWEVVSEDIEAIKEGLSGAKKHIKGLFEAVKSSGKALLRKKRPKISVVELSITIEESIRGAKKKVELVNGAESRSVSIQIPVGVRDGSVLRLRKKNDREELIIIFRLASHPYLSIKPKGLIIEVPVTVKEAMFGAQIKVPGLTDQILLKIPAGTQSGTELRLKGRGIQGRDSTGDLFVRVMVVTPTETEDSEAKDLAEQFESLYKDGVRSHLGVSLLGE
jgi:DnaJ-class molecular chaperone